MRGASTSARRPGLGERAATDRRRGSRPSSSLAHPRPQLGSGLLGEGDRGDLAHVDARTRPERTDAVDEHRRLARAGARLDEERVVRDRIATRSRTGSVGRETGSRRHSSSAPSPSTGLLSSTVASSAGACCSRSHARSRSAGQMRSKSHHWQFSNDEPVLLAGVRGEDAARDARRDRVERLRGSALGSRSSIVDDDVFHPPFDDMYQ